MSLGYSVQEIVDTLEDAEIQNCDQPEEMIISQVVTLHAEAEQSISFVYSAQFITTALTSKASILLINRELVDAFPQKRPLIVVKNAEYSLISILQLFHPPKKPFSHLSEKASIHPSATIGENTMIGDFVRIGANSKIGKDSIIEANVSIGENVTIGDAARIGANNVYHDGVTIGDRFVSFGNCTIGADGFRFVFTPAGHQKIPQVGSVIIGNDVEMGANCCVDRGGVGDTIIGDGCKFDNMVHIAHNCVLKKHVVIAAQSGMAGSTTVGNHVMISGHCALQDHIEIADGVILGGKTTVRKTISEQGFYVGEHTLSLSEFKKFRKNLSHLVHFEQWTKRLEQLEAQVSEAENKGDS